MEKMMVKERMVILVRWMVMRRVMERKVMNRCRKYTKAQPSRNNNMHFQLSF